MTVYLPSEVCGVLSVAQKHLDAANNAKWRFQNGYRRRECKQKHLSKVQKLVSRAKALLIQRGIPCP